MDPTANLAEQLELAHQIAKDFDFEDTAEHGTRLAELVLALHEWIMAGGFPPKQWNLADARELP